MNEFYYINTDIDRALLETGLALDELEALVGRFAAHSSRAGLLRGKVAYAACGAIEIRKCFGNKLLWQSEAS